MFNLSNVNSVPFVNKSKSLALVLSKLALYKGRLAELQDKIKKLEEEINLERKAKSSATEISKDDLMKLQTTDLVQRIALLAKQRMETREKVANSLNQKETELSNLKATREKREKRLNQLASGYQSKALSELKELETELMDSMASLGGIGCRLH